jgi:hypothetical protein
MLNPDFKEFAELLNAHRVEYLVVGGYALAAHGHPRYTGDIDFWLARNPDNIERLLTALRVFGFGSLAPKPEDFAPDSVIQRREVITVDGLPLNFIGLDDFKANKRASGRLKDLADLEALDDHED